MATIKMMQGDARTIPFSLTLNNEMVLSPDHIADLEVCIGSDDGALIRKLLSENTIGFDNASGKWFFRLSQEETLSLEPGSYSAVARPKFGLNADSDVQGIKIGGFNIIDGLSEEVI